MARPKKVKEELEEPRLEAPSVEEPVDANAGDYLRQYQVRKQALSGSTQSDPPAGSKAAKMKAELLSQPKIRFFIPRAPGESPTILQSVTLNGYRMDFPKQAYVDVPLQVAEVLAESLKQTDAALNQFRIDLDKRKEVALT